jgi:diaminohydroxyphosphoribosylaminopyrimidine deaminase/5-amino-6-(5-phosphoribosylamino)uracil reductase
MDHALFMKRALKLASRARGRTSPNPMVGAVLVKNGRIIAEDYHKRAGTPHAEVLVLGEAGDRARGATLYVTLEPCCHKGKRTPPCVDSIIRSGVRKLFVAVHDPNPKVSGRGVKRLEKAGVEVNVGVLDKEARKLNEAYTKYITRNRPFVIIKTAMTLDGKIATPTGESKWITGEKARRLVHRLRSESDAILTAVGTVKADDPELTARIRGGRTPVRIVIDPELSVPDGSRVLSSPPETFIVTRKNNHKRERLKAAGIKFIDFTGSLHLDWLMRELAGMGIMSVLIEGGSSLNSYALNDGVVDRAMFFIAPKIIGGKDSYPAVGGTLYRNLADSFRIADIKTRRLGGDILIEGNVVDPLR